MTTSVGERRRNIIRTHCPAGGARGIRDCGRRMDSSPPGTRRLCCCRTRPGLPAGRPESKPLWCAFAGAITAFHRRAARCVYARGDMLRGISHAARLGRLDDEVVHGGVGAHQNIAGVLVGPAQDIIVRTYLHLAGHDPTLHRPQLPLPTVIGADRRRPPPAGCRCLRRRIRAGSVEWPRAPP